MLEAISPVAGRSSFLLCHLGLPESQLSKLKEECHHNTQEYLRKGIICLLQENYSTSIHGLLTWRRLVVAVANTAGGNNHKLARKIAAEHKGSIMIIKSEATSYINLIHKSLDWVPSDFVI